MGLRGAKSVLFTITNLTLKALKEIARSRASADERLCRIDVDCSWVGHKLAAKSSNYEQAGEATAEVLYILAKAGFVVTPICDPPHRHHSKRESTDRVAKKEKTRLAALCPHYRLTSLYKKLRSPPMLTDQEKEVAQKKNLQL